MDVSTTIRQFAVSLKQMDTWIEKASAHAAARSFDVENFATARLAPDQFALIKQIQSASDAAKFAAAYLAGKQAPSNPDTETTIPQIRERLATVAAYLDTFVDEDFAGAVDRKVFPGWARGKHFRAADYLSQVAVPNFYFHVSMTYAILRHNGVPLGKTDFLGHVTLQD